MWYKSEFKFGYYFSFYKEIFIYYKSQFKLILQITSHRLKLNIWYDCYINIPDLFQVYILTEELCKDKK